MTNAPAASDTPRSSRRVFAIVPAAGRSRRMGTPKLLLPVAGRTVIAHVIAALQRARVHEIVVVIHPDDTELAREVARCGATAVQPTVAPAEMRQSVEIGLEHVRTTGRPQLSDLWLLIPADHPVIDQDVLQKLLISADVVSDGQSRTRRAVAGSGIWIPAFQGRSGHPTLFTWDYAEQVTAIPDDAGINWLVRRNSENVCRVAVPQPTVLWDMDTPDDYRKLREWVEMRRA